MSSSYSSPNGEIVVSSLVPQEAVDAAMRQYRLLHPCPDGDSCVGCDIDLADILDAGASSIGAEAIRWAIEQPFSSVLETPNEKLRRLADELEAGDN